MTDHSDKRLGKKPAAKRAALMASDILTGEVPATPTAADHFSKVKDWLLGRNDEFGTCGPTAVGNLLLLVTTYLSSQGVRVSDDDIFDLYRRSGNPNFNPDLAWNDPRQQDKGVVLQDMLDELLKNGIGKDPAGKPYKPLAFAKITPGDMDTLDKCIAIFGAVLLGVVLETAQQTQDVWDYHRSSEWGGHAITSGRYVDPAGQVSDRTGVVSWAEIIDMTRRFIESQEDEAWIIIWPWHLRDEGFMAGVNMSALADAYQELTGHPFPAVAPDPDPEPTPVDPPSADSADVALAPMLRHEASLRHSSKRFKNAANAWLEDKGL